MELVPADDNYIDKKEFTWDVISYDTDGFIFKLTFKDSKYISTSAPDTLKITFKNASDFMNPENKGLESVPDEFTLTVKIPPQGENLMSA